MKKIIASAGFVLALSTTIAFASTYPDQPVPPDKVSTFNEDLILYDTNPASLNEGGGEMILCMYLEDRNCIPEVDAGSSTISGEYFFVDANGSWFLPTEMVIPDNNTFVPSPSIFDTKLVFTNCVVGLDWWDVIAATVNGDVMYQESGIVPQETFTIGNTGSWPVGDYIVVFKNHTTGAVITRKRPSRATY
ncbi:MAG: hypothetical protein H6791_02220 [Candidatus Nomurabacteria bacterium]|nr:MAG: hypothetical protein H6791_02220 [Candidatus Nomurabacteria bacterium]